MLCPQTPARFTGDWVFFSTALHWFAAKWLRAASLVQGTNFGIHTKEPIPMPTHIRLIALLLLVLSLTVHAQPGKKNPRLTKKQFVQDSLKIMRMQVIRPQVRLENRMTYHKGQVLNLNGLDAGVLLKGKLRLTAGYYFLNDELSAYKTTVDGEDATRTIQLRYGSINTEFVYLNTRFVSLGMPLEFGFGHSRVARQYVTTGETFDRQGGLLFLADFGLSAVFKPIRALGVRGVVGYRKILINPVRNFNFNGFFTSVGVAVDIFEVIKDFRMYRLKKRYKRGDPLENAVDLITD